MGCIAYRHRQSYLLSLCNTSFIAKLKIHRGRNAATRLFLALRFDVSDVGADRSMLERHIAALSACNLRSLSGNATEIATCVRHLQRLRVWLHFRQWLQPLCCRLPLSATFLAMIFRQADISRRRTLMTRNRTIHFNCAKLGRCSGCKGKCALRVPPCFASLQQGNHPCGSTSLLRPLDCT